MLSRQTYRAFLVLALLAALSAGSSTNASAQEKEESSGSRVQLMLGASVSNEYKRGDLDTWFGELTGTTRQVDAGSPAFFIGRLSLLGSGSEGSLGFGLAVGAAVPADRSLWGTQTIFGGRTELVVNPFIAHVALPLLVPVSDGDGVTVSIAGYPPGCAGRRPGSWHLPGASTRPSARRRRHFGCRRIMEAPGPISASSS